MIPILTRYTGMSYFISVLETLSVILGNKCLQVVYYDIVRITRTLFFIIPLRFHSTRYNKVMVIGHVLLPYHLLLSQQWNRILVFVPLIGPRPENCYFSTKELDLSFYGPVILLRDTDD